MKRKDENIGDEDVLIYQTFWKVMLLSLASLLVAAGGVWIILNPGNEHYTRHIIGGWMALLFFGGGGLLWGGYGLYFKISRKPIITVFADRLEYYQTLKGTFTVHFEDVRRFRLTTMEIKILLSRHNFIAIDYKRGVLKKKYSKKQSTGAKRLFMRANERLVGAVETLPADFMSMKGQEICDLLNKRLKQYNKENSKKPLLST